MNKKSLCFLILFFISFTLTVVLYGKYINVPYFKGLYKKVQIDVIFKKQAPKIYFNDSEIKTYVKVDDNHYLFLENSYRKVQNIKIENIENVENLLVYNGYDVKQYKNPKSLIKVNNEKPLLLKAAVVFLSFFYNYKLHLISYIFLILFMMNLKCNLKFKNGYVFLLILFLSLFLRIQNLNELPFWDDEIYVLVHTLKGAKIQQLFNDPGNPFLFFVLFKIWRNIVTEEYYRFIAVVFNLLFNIAFYFYLKKWLNPKKALVGLFASSICVILIYFSQEIRSYMLLMLLSITSAILLFKFKSKKSQILYFINSILFLNTHFYAFFLQVFNLFFGISMFYKNKKRLKLFLLNNLTVFFVFLPSVLSKTESLNNNFNAWIQKPLWHDFIQVFWDFSFNLYICALFLILSIAFYFLSQKRKEKLFISYNFLSIVFVIIFSFIFSYLIKPVFMYRYFYVVFPFYLALCVYFVTKKYKFGFLVQFIMFLMFFTTGRLNAQNLFNNPSLFRNYVLSDIDTKKRNYVFYPNTVVGYDKIEKEISSKAKLIFLPVDKGFDDIDYEKYDIIKPCICYSINLYVKPNVLKNALKIELFKTPLGVITKAYY